MIDEAEETEVIEETIEVDVEQDADTEGDGEIIAADPESGETDEDDDGDEVIVSIGGEAPPPEPEAKAPEWVRELRKSNREKERRIKELEAKLNSASAEPKPAPLGAKPTLEDLDYDTEEYEKQLASWYERKREADLEEANAQSLRDAEAKEWQGKLDAYAKAKASLKVRDYEDAEAVALDTFDVTQQGIVLQGSDNPALIIYALGKDTKRAKELASINDPVKFAFAVAKLETQLKVSNRKAATAPERTIGNASGRISGSVDSTLERLRAEALKTGDLSKVMAYKRSKQK